MHSDIETGHRWPVDREMFRIGAQYLLVEPDARDEPAPPVELAKREEVAVGVG